MNALVFDVETTHVEKRGGGYTPLPYFGNKLVSIGWKWLTSTVAYDCYYHSTQAPDIDAPEIFQRALDVADLVVGHNIKFDLQWIRACGFTYEGDVYDTMVAEYILSRARRWPLGLAALTEKYDVTRKEKDMVAPYLEAGATFYEIPWEIVKEYGTADVIATQEVAQQQLNAFGTTYGDIYADRKWASSDTAPVA